MSYHLVLLAVVVIALGYYFLYYKKNDAGSTITQLDMGGSGTDGGTPKNKKPVDVVLFYANWCGYCNNFMPTWDTLQQSITGANLVKVDCGVQKDVATLHDIKAFPTIRVYPNGDENYVEYKGDRSIGDLKGFISMYN